jgi:ATP-binding cassette subfamily C protein
LVQGIGLLMIIPLLQLIGFGATGGSGISRHIGLVLARVGLPLNLTSILGIYLALVGATALAGRFRDVLNTEIVQGFTNYWRNQLYEALTRVDWLDFTRLRAPDITHVFTSGLETVGVGTQQMLILVSTLVIAAVHLAVAVTLSPAMTVLALATGAVLLLIMRPFNHRSVRTGEELFRARNEMFAVVAEHLGGMKVARSYGIEGRYAQNFRDATDALMEQFIRFTRINATTRVYYEIGAAVVLSVLFWGGEPYSAPSCLPAPDGLYLFPAAAQIFPGATMLAAPRPDAAFP